MRSLLLASLLLAATQAEASKPRHWPQPEEFRTRIELDVSGRSGLVQLPLPLAVYQRAQSADFADLRVYNAEGELLAHGWHQPAAQRRWELREEAAVQFPVESQAAGGEPAPSLELRLQADGALYLSRTPGAPTAAGSRLAQLVLDLGPAAAGEVLDGLRFELPEGQAGYRARIAIERSEDLKLWDRVAISNLDWIEAAHAEARLVNDRVPLSRGEGRYLRLHWLEGEPQLFPRVLGAWRRLERGEPSPLQWTLDGRPGEVEGDWVYVASPAIAATAIGLELPQANTLMPVAIGHYRQQRERRDGAVQRVFVENLRSSFYRLDIDGRERRSSLLRIAPLAHEQWVLRVLHPGLAAPRLQLQWEARTLLLTARGSGLYLAVGASPTQTRHWLGGPLPLSQLAPGFSQEDLDKLETARAGTAAPMRHTRAEAASSPGESTASAASTRRWVLWTVLAIGVFLLALMSWRLSRQMGGGG